MVSHRGRTRGIPIRCSTGTHEAVELRDGDRGLDFPFPLTGSNPQADDDRITCGGVKCVGMKVAPACALSGLFFA